MYIEQTKSVYIRESMQLHTAVWHTISQGVKHGQHYIQLIQLSQHGTNFGHINVVHTYDALTIDESPVEKRVVDKCLQDSHYTVLVLSQHSHHIITGLTEVALNAGHLKQWDAVMYIHMYM